MLRVSTPHKYVGLSTDEKPILDAEGRPVPVGSQFIEINTGKKFIRGADGWGLKCYRRCGDGEGEPSGPTVPDAFTVGQWGLFAAAGELAVNIIPPLPDNGGSEIINIQYRYDAGSGYTGWISTGGVSGFTILDLENGSLHSVQIRAVNAVGASLPSDVKTATPEAEAEPPSLTLVGSPITGATVQIALSNFSPALAAGDVVVIFNRAGSGSTPLADTVEPLGVGTAVQINGAAVPNTKLIISAAIITNPAMPNPDGMNLSGGGHWYAGLRFRPTAGYKITGIEWVPANHAADGDNDPLDEVPASRGGQVLASGDFALQTMPINAEIVRPLVPIMASITLAGQTAGGSVNESAVLGVNETNFKFWYGLLGVGVPSGDWTFAPTATGTQNRGAQSGYFRFAFEPE